MKGFLLTMLLLMGTAEGAEMSAKYDHARLVFPCDAMAITNIWIDDEVFWDSGPIWLEPCSTFEISAEWNDSIVIEWIAKTKDGQNKLLRFRLYPGGYMVPEDKIPQSRFRSV